ncbi:energy transducer TonB [Methylocaldum sp. MU1018]
MPGPAPACWSKWWISCASPVSSTCRSRPVRLRTRHEILPCRDLESLEMGPGRGIRRDLGHQSALAVIDRRLDPPGGDRTDIGSQSAAARFHSHHSQDRRVETGSAARAQTDDRDRAGGLVVLSQVLPEYPPRARAQRIEGWVRLEIEVSPAGTVSAARVVAAKPERVFDEAALKAIRRWR